MYTVDDARNDRKQGWTDTVLFQRCDRGWLCEVCNDDGTTRTITDTKGKPLVFRSLDALVDEVEQAGFDISGLSNRF